MKSAARTLALTPETLANRLAGLGFTASDTVLRDLSHYLVLLMKWNKAMNLVGTKTWEETLDTLAVDSFYLASFLPVTGLPPSPVTLDLGAGAGLPGIPLRFLWQEGKYTLIEVREKRALFMKTVLASCHAGETSVFHGKAEDYFAAAQPADCIISRAFMPWKDLLGFVYDALAPGGSIIFLALSGTPEDLPAGWLPGAEAGYTAQGKQRYLWSLVKEKA